MQDTMWTKLLDKLKHGDDAQPQQTHPFAAAARTRQREREELSLASKNFSKWDFENKPMIFANVTTSKKVTGTRNPLNPKATESFLKISKYLVKMLGIDEQTISFLSAQKLVIGDVAAKVKDRGMDIDARRFDPVHEHKNDIIWIDLGIVNDHNIHFFADLERVFTAASGASVLLIFSGNLEAIHAIPKLQSDERLAEFRKFLDFFEEEGLVLPLKELPIQRTQPGKRKREEEEEDDGLELPIEEMNKLNLEEKKRKKKATRRSGKRKTKKRRYEDLDGGNGGGEQGDPQGGGLEYD
ncbi:hypothetical protein PRZ48_006231 [Zasmidium cellare]|uniref:Uncharacterized protein n=1 Tax=Zasmidium cellare TaxID=395010 RepID=A0ABR0EMW2_ZASCE|nr:hypothetical protein PRZ48_006231 [Zasmidium cellare]